MATNDQTLTERMAKVESSIETERPHLATKADLEKLKSDLTFRIILISAALLGLIKIIPPYQV
ncbi:MAG: hypothetical protein OXI34_18100 [Chloroflexota bacterium]|nr:hypothetical protein [Chloroflexota bacterium]MDE2945966.1 hypothetical protein [Chloroflexota bacterium]